MAETLGYSNDSRYRRALVRPNHMNLNDEIRRALTPRLPAQSRNPVPDASCDGTQGLSDLARAARGARRKEAVQGNQAGQAGTCACEGPGPGVHGRSNEALTLGAGAS